MAKRKVSKVLDGVRVAEWGVFHIGPAAGAMLGDLGAEVIKIEVPGTGDPLRGLKRAAGGLPPQLPHGRHAFIEDINRNTKSITVNLKHPEGKEIMYDLVKVSDVFLTNFPSRNGKELGLDYKTLRRYNRKLIYASASAFGYHGPDAEFTDLEMGLYARSGIMSSSGEPGMPPVFLTVGVADRAGAIFLAYGVLAALLARAKTGMGQEVRTSGLGALIALQSPSFMLTLLKDIRVWPRWDRKAARNALYNYYECKDGRWIALSLIPDPQFWPTFCSVVGRPEWEKDPRFVDTDKRSENGEVLCALCQEILRNKTAREWQVIFRKNAIRCSVIQTLHEVCSDPQVLANNYITDYDHPDLGKIKMVGFPVELTKTPATISQCAPHVGQHTEEVLTETLGYSWDKVTDLRDRGVL